MADAQDTTVSPAATTVSAPAADAPAPIVSTPVTPTITSDSPAIPVAPATAVAEPAATPEPAKAITPTPSTTESVLGDVKPAEAAKPAEGEKKGAATEGDKPKDASAEVPKVELPIYEAFNVPENVTLDKEPLDAFTKILGEIETGKLDHAGMQSKGQELIDLAAKSTLESINRLNDYYVGIHEGQKKEWFEKFKADPDMGGDKLDATVSALRSAVDTYAGNAAQVTEFRTLMKETGVGNHPALIRLLNNMQQKINEYTTEGNSNRIVPGAKPAPSKVKPYQMFYQGNS